MDFRAGDWSLSLETQDLVLDNPSFTVRHVWLGLSPSDPDYDAHEAETEGSDPVWGDAWRFERNSTSLVSFYLEIPEQNVPTAPEIVRKGAARLVALDTSGTPPHTSSRHFDRGILTCGQLETPEKVDGFEVAPDFSILLHNGEFWGWEFAAAIDQSDANFETDCALVAKYYELVSEDTLDDLDDRGILLRERLLQLRTEALNSGGETASMVADHISKVIENFYG